MGSETRGRMSRGVVREVCDECLRPTTEPHSSTCTEHLKTLSVEERLTLLEKRQKDLEDRQRLHIQTGGSADWIENELARHRKIAKAVAEGNL